VTELFKNKVALITGGNSGIGKAISIRAASEGAKVVIGARNEKTGKETVDYISSKGGEAFFIKADMSDPKQIDSLFEKTIEKYGEVDLACNNSAIGLAPDIPLHEYDTNDWNHMMSVNLTAPFLCMKHEIQHMLGKGGGSIVNMSSVNGLIGTKGFTTYTANKHGLNGLTKSAALDYADKGIRINAVCPGGVETPLLHQMIGSHPEAWEKARDFHPIKQLGTPESIAGLVAFLWSDASSYVTGSCLSIDGALTAQ
jgi:NAD(P)-dependent dehydrogenase (short-subunit alcohol dehydrogenase family)